MTNVREVDAPPEPQPIPDVPETWTSTRQAETEQRPAFEIHLGESHTDHGQHARHAIVWLNGRRWEGDLTMQEAGT